VSTETTGGVRLAPLTWTQRRFLFSLALPAFGLSLAYTIVTTYGPVLLESVSGPVVTGALIGAEGVLAMFIPLLVGGASDRLHTRWGGRLPFVLAGSVLGVVSLVLLPLDSDSLLWVALCLGGFFVAYFVYYVPYNALYPDLVPREAIGRSQGFQGTFRATGLLIGMAFGGIWLAAWHPLPFLIGAVAVAVVTAGLFWLVLHHEVEEHHHLQQHRGVRDALLMVRTDGHIRHWMIANTCWEASLGALRTFVILYFTVGLQLSLHTTSAALALVGVGALLAAPVAGRLADRYGPERVIRVATWIFIAGLLPTQFFTSSLYVIAIVPVTFAAVVMMTLPYAILIDLLPQRRDHGVGAGLFQLSRGFGIVLGPLLAGLATEASSGVDGVFSYSTTSGYSSVFGVSAVFLLLSMPFMRRLERETPPR
jgi:maltose/moltooligosaccharide transporter